MDSGSGVRGPPAVCRTRYRVRRVSPLAKGFLTGTVNSSTQLIDSDVRSTIPRFASTNRDANQALVDHVHQIADSNHARTVRR